MFGRDLWSIGEFKFHRVSDETYNIATQVMGAIRVRKHNAHLVTIDKSWTIAKSKVIHCGVALYPENLRPLDRLVIFDDSIHAYHCDSNFPRTIVLPNTEHDFEAFVNAGGTISVEDHPDKAILDYKNRRNIGCQFKAVGRQVFIEGYETEICILELDKDIDAILPSTIIFKDGTVKHLPVSLSPTNYETQLLYKFHSKNAETRELYLSQVRLIDETLCTADGYNMKQLFVDIDNYLRTYHYKPDETLKQRHTYEALTEMLINYKDPTKFHLIQQRIMDVQSTDYAVQSKVQAGRDIAFGVILLIAAAALLSVGIVFCSVLAIISHGASLGPGILALCGAFGLVGCAAVKFHSARVGYQYDNKINSAITFFDSKPNSVVPSDDDTKSGASPLLGNYESVIHNHT